MLTATLPTKPLIIYHARKYYRAFNLLVTFLKTVYSNIFGSLTFKCNFSDFLANSIIEVGLSKHIILSLLPIEKVLAGNLKIALEVQRATNVSRMVSNKIFHFCVPIGYNFFMYFLKCIINISYWILELLIHYIKNQMNYDQLPAYFHWDKEIFDHL